MNRLLALLIVGTLLSCADETVVNGVSENEANEILVLLDTAGIGASKLLVDSGREVFYNVTVAGADSIDAYSVLNRNHYPRRPIARRSDVFAEAGLIPTSTQSKAKMLVALEGEIERQLLLIDGMLDVEINLNMPEESALRAGEPPPPATASVVYLSRTKSIKSTEVANLVAASVENLNPERVQVIPTFLANAEDLRVTGSPTRGVGILGSLTPNVQRGIATGAAMLFILMAFVIFYQSLSLRNVRGRFRRLQEEIARARRPKAAEGLPG